jgi:hypothetical protein
MSDTQADPAADPAADRPYLTQVILTLCSPCLNGAGGECHVPGCALWMNRAPDQPLWPAVAAATIYNPVES